MIGAQVLPSHCDLARMASVDIHDPNRWDSARGGPAKDDPTVIRRFARPKIPHGGIRMGKARERTLARIESANFRATARQVRLVIAVEMVRVRSLRLEFPGYFRTGQASRKED